ncbi:MAG: protease modulator HflC [Gammaproteobacteria bacterium]
MNNARPLALFLGGVFLLMALLGNSLFIVYPWQSALVLQFGEIVAAKQSPGLYAKAPWQSLRLFDSRVLTIDTEEPDRYITAEKENLLVDSYVKWRIIDPPRFYERLLGSETSAAGRLQEIINRGLRDEIGKRTVKDVVTGERERVMQIMRDRANEGADELGLEVLDVRMKRVDLPAGVSENVYKNMIEERRRIANERRSEGEAEKEKIRAEADRERVVILSDAARRGEEIRGRGDADAAGKYAAAFSQHLDFYDFYRTLAAYRKTLGAGGDFFILSPESDFFRFLKEESGGAPPAANGKETEEFENAENNEAQ